MISGDVDGVGFVEACAAHDVQYRDVVVGEVKLATKRGQRVAEQDPLRRWKQHETTRLVASLGQVLIDDRGHVRGHIAVAE